MNLILRLFLRHKPQVLMLKTALYQRFYAHIANIFFDAKRLYIVNLVQTRWSEAKHVAALMLWQQPSALVDLTSIYLISASTEQPPYTFHLNRRN